MRKISLKGLSEIELQNLCENLSFPKFHGTQIYEWIYKHKIDSFQSMQNIPKKLIKMLSETYFLNSLKIKSSSKSKIDLTTKFLLETHDNNFIETVSIIDNNRHTVCLSSQIGCNVDCDFCATGKMGIKRNLKIDEIIDQLIIIQKETKKTVNNIVFMGMGEPFLNYTNVIKACNIFSSNNAFNLGTKRITISTSGIVPKIDLFIQEKHKYKLAISLNASNDKLRDKLIPINKKWNITSILNSLQKYDFNETRPIMFEYVLLKDINDGNDNAKELINLLHGFKCKINLIPFNEIDGIYRRPGKNRINEFAKILNDNTSNLRVLTRWSKGEDIDAGCGQLATKHEN